MNRNFFIFTVGSNGRGTWHTTITARDSQAAADEFLNKHNKVTDGYLVVVPGRDSSFEIANSNGTPVLFKVTVQRAQAHPGI